MLYYLYLKTVGISNEIIEKNRKSEIYTRYDFAVTFRSVPGGEDATET